MLGIQQKKGEADQQLEFSTQGALTSGEVWQEAADVCHAMSGLSATNQIALPS